MSAAAVTVATAAPKIPHNIPNRRACMQGTEAGVVNIHVSGSSTIPDIANRALLTEQHTMDAKMQPFKAS